MTEKDYTMMCGSCKFNNRRICNNELSANNGNSIDLEDGCSVYEEINKPSLEEIEFSNKTLKQCKSIITKWLYIKDPKIIEVVFSFAIGEKVPGDPLWLFLVGAPGTGKTELLRALDGKNYYHLSDLTSKTFVSGLMIGKGDEREKIEDLLPQLKDKVLLMKDFTTILEKNKDERREIIAQLREIYDGMFSKKFGTLDKKVEYRNNFGMIAGVTPIIDKHWKLMQQLGERFLKWRWVDDADETTRRAERNEGKEEIMRRQIKEAVMGFLTNLKIKEIEFPSDLIEPLIQVAKFLAICRTPVTIKSGNSDFYFDFIPTPEQPTRLVKQLKKFVKCLTIIRGKDKPTKEEVLIAIELALNTAPQDRLDVLKTIEKTQHNSLEGCTITEIKHKVKLPETSLRNICQQLEMLKLIEITKVSRETNGFKEFVAYYKLSKKVCVVSPNSFLEYTKKVGGYTAEVKNS